MNFDTSYYEARLAKCRHQAETATNPFVRDAHMKFVAHYEKIIGDHRAGPAARPQPERR